MKRIASLTGAQAPHVRATYHDTDRMGHVYYGNYATWFEIGRNEILRHLGHRYREWEDVHGVFLPVAELHIEYRRSAEYDDLVRIETHVTRITRASVEFYYEIFETTGDTLLAQGRTKHAFIDRAGKVVRVADRLIPELFAIVSSPK